MDPTLVLGASTVDRALRAARALGRAPFELRMDGFQERVEVAPAEGFPTAAKALDVVVLLYQGSSGAISARVGFCRSRSETNGASVGQGIAIAGSSNLIPLSVGGS